MGDKNTRAVDTTGTSSTGNDTDSRKDGKKSEQFVMMLAPYHPKESDTPDPQPCLNKPEEKKEVQRALKCEEFGRMLDFGLGRGVNATQKSPWFEKSTLQVREVGPHNIIGTEEGGILKSYVQEIWSIEEVQSRLSASVPLGEKISIGIDAELSRNYNTTRRSIGQQLITRTVSFNPHFKHDQPVASNCSVYEAYRRDHEKIPTFEESLCLWIIEKVNKKSIIESGTKTIVAEKYTDSCDALASFIADPRGVTDIKTFLEEACQEFIETFSITHYVSGIQLGAAKYEVLSEEEYLVKVGMKNQLQIMQLANFSAEGSVKSNWGKKESTITEIGRFKAVNNGTTSHKTVERGSADEAVVGVEFEPISVLVTLSDLKKALNEAITDYIDKESHSKAGPFIISCNNEELFLKVKKNEDRYEVIATRDVTKASNFHISYNEDGLSAYEFSIVYFDEIKIIDHSHSVLEDTEIDAIPRYLNAQVNMFGTNDGPLAVRLAADNKCSKMTLQSRRMRTSTPADTKDWMTGQDVFYIRCKDSGFFSDSYVCVRDLGAHAAGNRYTTCCVSSTQKEELPDHHMLFRLMRSKKKIKRSEKRRGKRYGKY